MFENFPYNRKAYKLLKECSHKQDLSEWNQYRKDNNNAPINLKFTDLSNFYLVGANLSYVDMRLTEFDGSNFIGSDVKKANISFNIVRKFFVAIVMIIVLFITIFHFGFDVPIKMAINIVLFIHICILAVLDSFYNGTIISSIIGCIVIAGIVGGSIGIGVGILLLSFMLYVIFSVNQQAIAKAKNPTKCIGFNPKYLEKTDINIIKKENQQLKEELKEISDEELKKSIETRIAKNEEKTILLYEQQTAKESFELKVKNLLIEIQKPYQYLKTHIHIQYVLIVFFGAIIVGIFALGIVYAQSFYLARETTFTNLFTKASIPEFGTLFGVIVFYGTPILLAIAIMVYLFSKINHSLDKITAYQSKEQKIMELIAIIKAKIFLGLEEDEFKIETTKMLDRLQDITFAEYSKELNTQISEPTMDFINNTIKTAEERIKEELGSKEEKK
jgi:ABC-type multidrug transport system fused ATPase/permease subunit